MTEQTQTEPTTPTRADLVSALHDLKAALIAARPLADEVHRLTRAVEGHLDPTRFPAVETSTAYHTADLDLWIQRCDRFIAGVENGATSHNW